MGQCCILSCRGGRESKQVLCYAFQYFNKSKKKIWIFIQSFITYTTSLSNQQSHMTYSSLWYIFYGPAFKLSGAWTYLYEVWERKQKYFLNILILGTYWGIFSYCNIWMKIGMAYRLRCQSLSYIARSIDITPHFTRNWLCLRNWYIAYLFWRTFSI